MTKATTHRALLLAAALLAGCGARIVPVIPDGMPTAGTSSADPTFEVVARIAGAADPLPVVGGGVSYAELQPALGQAVLRAVRPRHDSVLTVELISDEASHDGARLTVTLVARATLRTDHGATFVAQHQVVCRDGAIVAPSAGAAVIWSCMTRLGQDLRGWLDSQHP
jgi:hypothetical protein